MKLLLVAVICFAAGYFVSSQFMGQGESTETLESEAQGELQSNNSKERQGAPVDQVDGASTQVDPASGTPSIADLTSQIGADNQMAIIFDTQHTPHLDVNSVVNLLSKKYSAQKMKLTSITGREYQAVVIYGFADRREAQKAKPKLERQLALRGIIRYTPSCINNPPDDEGFVCSDNSSDSSSPAKAST